MATAGKNRARHRRNASSAIGCGSAGRQTCAASRCFRRVGGRRSGADVTPRAAGEPDAPAILGAALCRDDIPGFPEISEPQVMRHFLRSRSSNFGQALQFYPLGSCTMKYNPVLNDDAGADRLDRACIR